MKETSVSDHYFWLEGRRTEKNANGNLCFAVARMMGDKREDVVCMRHAYQSGSGFLVPLRRECSGSQTANIPRQSLFRVALALYRQ